MEASMASEHTHHPALLQTAEYRSTTQEQSASRIQELYGLESSKNSTQQDYKESSRRKQVLESEKDRNTASYADSTREDYAAAIKEEEESIKATQSEIEDLNQQVQLMREDTNEAQKRLTIVRLMSMLDELQNSLKEKIDESTEEEEERSQELLKVMQELTRSRERTLSMITKKEREMKSIIQLKKSRVAELERESSKNKNNLDQFNDNEVLTVAQRIQKERRQLIEEVMKEEEINNKLADAMRDTKYSAEPSQRDRGAALSADQVRCNSDNPEEEVKELRKRITAADAERRRLTLKTEELKKKAEGSGEEYSEKMSQLKREILMYKKECSRLEKENKDLEKLCDSIGQSLQNS